MPVGLVLHNLEAGTAPRWCPCPWPALTKRRLASQRRHNRLVRRAGARDGDSRKPNAATAGETSAHSQCLWKKGEKKKKKKNIRLTPP